MIKKSFTKKFLLSVGFCIICISLSGCGNSIDVVIEDDYTTTYLTTTEGCTVDAAIAEAEITISDNDVIEPSLDSEIANGTTISIKHTTNVTVSADGNEISVELTGGKVQDALDKAGITLDDNDVVDCQLEMYCTDNMNITVERRVQASITVDGETSEVVTSAETVSELLAEQNISLGDEDIISAEPDSSLTEGMEIVINRQETREETVTEEIAYETVTNYSSSITYGVESVTQEGINGEKEITYSVTYVDGVETDREVIDEVITKEPQDEIITIGTKKASSSGSGSSGKTVVSRETVYDCDGSGHGYYIITYSDGSVSYQDF